MSGRRFIHTLSFPEHLWLDFFREFFSQNTLIVDEDGLPLINNFYFDVVEGPENRRFDVLLEADMKGHNPNILPSLVIEDLGATSLGISTNRLATWAVSPQTSKTRSDLIRTTYVLHCTSRQRGESRLLAAIVSNAIIVFYDQLLEAGLHKIEPWSIGKTTPIKADADEVYVDTPVQITFEYQQTWKTIEDGATDVKRYCLKVQPEEWTRYIHTIMDVADAAFSIYVSMTMNLENPNANIYVNMAADLIEPLREEAFVLMSQNIADPVIVNRYVRTSMRVS